MKRSEICLLRACAEKNVPSKIVLAAWAFLKDSDEKMLEMSDYLHAKESVRDGNVIAKMTELSMGVKMPANYL